MSYKTMVEMHGKRCPHCTKKKKAADFAKNSSRTDGLSVYCKSCYAELYADSQRQYESTEKGKSRKAAFLKAHPEAPAEWSKKYRRANPVRCLRGVSNEQLRKQMDANDKLYSVEQSLIGSSMGVSNW